MLAVPAGTLAERAAHLTSLAWLPAPLLLQTVFFLGLAMLFSALAVFVRDVGQIIPLSMMVWMFFTPIFYPEKIVVDAATAGHQLWLVTAMKCNPMYHLLAMWRGVFAFESDARFPLDSLWIFAAIALCVFLLGHGCFHAWKGRFSDEV
jgi:ABC-2 type transport system permease protein